MQHYYQARLTFVLSSGSYRPAQGQSAMDAATAMEHQRAAILDSRARGVIAPALAPSVEDGIAQSRDFFDRAAWGVLCPERAILQSGCGMDRFERELAPRVRLAFGIDLSKRMLAAASRRCSALPNVLLDRRDLIGLAEECGFDVLVRASYPFRTWDGLAFRLRRRP